jgi:hypothetical protein
MDTNINGNKMQSKHLRALIREAITEVLSEATQETTIDYKDPNTPDKILNIDPADTSTINKLKTNSKVSSVTAGTKKIKEAQKYTLVDPEFDTTEYVNQRISGVSLADIINFFKENPGTEKKRIQIQFGFVKPQIANAIVNALADEGILSRNITPGGEGELTAEPNYNIGAEDFFVGNRLTSIPTRTVGTDEDEVEDMEPVLEPEMAAPVQSNISDDDYAAWMDYSKYAERLGRTKSAITQYKKQRQSGDDLSSESNELERLIALKTSLEQRITNIVNTNEYVKTRAEQGAIESEDEINETVLKRLKKLANI